MQGRLDVVLDDVGIDQAADAAKVLADRLGDRPCRIVSSPLARALTTAQALAEVTGVRLVTDPDLMEISVGSWEGLLREEVAERHPDDFAAWVAGEDRPFGGGESRGRCAARVVRCLRRHIDATSSGSLVVVSHGAALGGAMHLLLGLESTQPRVTTVLRNAHWAELGRHRGRWSLEAYNLGPAVSRRG
jgi:probable phosphoglycerate mutase